MSRSVALETRDFVPAMWPILEKLFGPRGACGGCWCMSWRIEKGEKWDAIKGDQARDRFCELISTGKVLGTMAFAAGEPVGWCTYGPRSDFSRLDRAPSLACDDAASVWSIPCFFIKAGSRGTGVATALLNHSVAAMKKRKVRIIEGYPVRPKRAGETIPAAFAWTGTRSLFEKAGFTLAGNEGGGKERVRLTLK